MLRQVHTYTEKSKWQCGHGNELLLGRRAIITPHSTGSASPLEVHSAINSIVVRCRSAWLYRARRKVSVGATATVGSIRAVSVRHLSLFQVTPHLPVCVATTARIISSGNVRNTFPTLAIISVTYVQAILSFIVPRLVNY